MSYLRSLPRAWKNLTGDDKTELREIKGVLLDIDETLSTRGKLTAEAFAALWALKNSNFKVVPVTGRPAGWCDHIARFWPVDAVVGENGAFAFFMSKDGRMCRLETPSGVESVLIQKTKLAALKDNILKKFPHARWASDQGYREFDLAIDICEDVPVWSSEQIDELLRFCREAGAHAKLSSIHVNAWFGDYDKRSGISHLVANWSGCMVEALPLQWVNEWLFIGDSPNDEPLFLNFPCSVGVANLRSFIVEPKYGDQESPQVSGLKHLPRWITEAESGAGFVEMAKTLINIKYGKSE